MDKIFLRGRESGKTRIEWFKDIDEFIESRKVLK